VKRLEKSARKKKRESKVLVETAIAVRKTERKAKREEEAAETGSDVKVTIWSVVKLDPESQTYHSFLNHYKWTLNFIFQS